MPISLDTIIVSVVIGGVGWALKIAIQELIKTLLQTMATVEVFRQKIDGFSIAIAEIEKMKKDLNQYYSELKKIKENKNV